MKNKSYYENLKDLLPFAAQADAAKLFNISPSAVSQIVAGKTTNVKVIEYLLQRARLYQKSLNNIRREVEGLKKETEVQL